jgi:hypothetical protein
MNTAMVSLLHDSGDESVWDYVFDITSFFEELVKINACSDIFLLGGINMDVS